MASDNVTVIEIITRVSDQTDNGAASTEKNLSKIEKSMLKAQKSIDKMKKMSKLELAIYAKDMASKIIQNVYILL